MNGTQVVQSYKGVEFAVNNAQRLTYGFDSLLLVDALSAKRTGKEMGSGNAVGAGYGTK